MDWQKRKKFSLIQAQIFKQINISQTDQQQGQIL